MANHTNSRGAQNGNRNAIRTGVYSFLTTGKYPRGASYVGRLIGQLRHSLESIVLGREGEVSVFNAAVIQSACRHEGRAQLLQRWLREIDGGGNVKKPPSLQDRVSILREIGNASDSRDRCLRALGLHEKPTDDDAWPTITVAPRATDVPAGPCEAASTTCNPNSVINDERTPTTTDC